MNKSKVSVSHSERFLDVMIWLNLFLNAGFFLFPFLETVEGVDFLDIRALSWSFGVLQLAFAVLIFIALGIIFCTRAENSFSNNFWSEWEVVQFLIDQLIYIILTIVILSQYVRDNSLYYESDILNEINQLQGNQVVGRFDKMENRFLSALFFTYVASAFALCISVVTIQKRYRLRHKKNSFVMVQETPTFQGFNKNINYNMVPVNNKGPY